MSLFMRKIITTSEIEVSLITVMTKRGLPEQVLRRIDRL